MVQADAKTFVVQVQDEPTVVAAENVVKVKVVMLLAYTIMLEEEVVAADADGEPWPKVAGFAVGVTELEASAIHPYRCH